MRYAWFFFFLGLLLAVFGFVWVDRERNESRDTAVVEAAASEATVETVASSAQALAQALGVHAFAMEYNLPFSTMEGHRLLIEVFHRGELVISEKTGYLDYDQVRPAGSGRLELILIDHARTDIDPDREEGFTLFHKVGTVEEHLAGELFLESDAFAIHGAQSNGVSFPAPEGARVPLWHWMSNPEGSSGGFSDAADLKRKFPEASAIRVFMALGQVHQGGGQDESPSPEQPPTSAESEPVDESGF